MAMMRWEPFREMEVASRRFAPCLLPDNSAAGDDASAKEVGSARQHQRKRG